MFLGMGNQELYLLGYEDIEEFRNYHNDVADLFINKPGYIFKFKNFSWIDYTLHSGTPNKRVLIRTKSGREVDTSLHIHEIYLTQDIFGEKTCFGVEFTNTPFKNEMPMASVTPSSNTSSIYEEPNTSFLAPEPDNTHTFSFDYTPSTDTVSSDNEDTASVEDTYSAPISFNSPATEESHFKLKIDTAILETLPPVLTEEEPLSITPKAYESIDEIQTKDLASLSNLESYPDDKYEDLQNDTLLLVDTPRLNVDASVFEPAQEPLFDFSLIADELGLDISTLAIIISEYIEELEHKINLISSWLEQNEYALAKEEISRLRSVALHLHIMPLYQQFERLENSLKDANEDATFRALLLVKNVISDLKESVQ